ncbi:MAG: ABC transporter substrate-binding protein [Negativicutes bacterium]|jgi:putative aldouronate transport system substrate-binding protein
MKKLIALLTLIMFTALVFSGCGGNQAKDDMHDEVELVWYTVEFGGLKDLPKVQEKVNEYLKQKINAKIKLIAVPSGDYDNKMRTLASTGEAFDITFTCFWANPYSQAVAQGFLLPLDDLLNEYGKDLQKTEIPELWTAARINGKIYAVPTNGDITYQQAWVFNKALVEKFNIDLNAIKSFKDLELQLEKVHAKDKGLIGFSNNSAFCPADEYDFVVERKMPGAVLISDKSCKIFNQYKDPKFIETLKTYRDMYNKGLLPTGVPLKETENIFQRGRTVCSLNVMSPDLDSILSSRYGFPTISIAANPRGVKTTRKATGNMNAISSTSKHPERAMMFLNLVNTDPYLANLLAFGIEGIHYKKLDNTTIEFLPEHKNYIMPKPLVGNCFNMYLTKDDPKNMLELVNKANSEAAMSPLYGFTFNPEPVRIEFSAIQNVLEEYGDQLWSGQNDVGTTIDTFMSKVNAAGMDKVMVEMQKQIDEWQKAKK